MQEHRNRLAATERCVCESVTSCTQEKARAYRLAQELCLGQFDVWEGRVPEQVCRGYEQLPSGLPVGDQSQDCSLIPVIASHEVPECALLAVKERVSEAAWGTLEEVR